MLVVPNAPLTSTTGFRTQRREAVVDSPKCDFPKKWIFLFPWTLVLIGSGLACNLCSAWVRSGPLFESGPSSVKSSETPAEAMNYSIHCAGIFGTLMRRHALWHFPRSVRFGLRDGIESLIHCGELDCGYQIVQSRLITTILSVQIFWSSFLEFITFILLYPILDNNDQLKSLVRVSHFHS